MRKLYLLFVFCGLFLTSCVREFKEISVSRINNFKISKMDIKSVEGEINVTITNPNNTSFKVYKSKADIYIGDTKMGVAKIKKKVKVDPNSSVEKNFILSGSLQGLNFGTLSGIMGGKSPVVQIKGYIKAGKWYYKKKFPVDQQQRLSGKDFKGMIPGF